MVAFLLVLVLLFLVVWAVASPWRRRVTGEVPHQTDERSRQAAAYVLDLEAARDAKYREIRDAELDNQTDKLSDADFSAIDATLRTEAVSILRDLDRAQKRLEKLRTDESDASEETRAAGSVEDPELESAHEANRSASASDGD